MGFGTTSDTNFLSSLQSLSMDGSDGKQGGSPEEWAAIEPPRLEMDPSETGFGLHYDDVFELEEEEDGDYIDVEEYRRIAMQCAGSFIGNGWSFRPPAPGIDALAAAAAKDNGDDDRLSAIGEASYWKGEAEKYFDEAVKLKAMVMALADTFEEVDDENDEMYVAGQTAHREILMLNYHLDIKQIEQVRPFVPGTSGTRR
jgi:hypothetical protein